MTGLVLHNTLTRRKEPFAPLDPGHVRMYVCGPTVYDRAHLGNARPVIVFDVLYRVLKRLYPRVTYARNITDVEDKIIAAAAANKEPIAALTARTEAMYHADMDALGALRPDVEPRATDHVAEMVALIEKLVARGHAYEADGHVLFGVPSMTAYGELSGRSRDEMIAGARVEVAPYKRDPADFVLWKPSTPEQPGWPSPWGRGRPGWHIECSAMSERWLGMPFDIHGGGIDLIFPHHENEIAQTRCAHGIPLMAKVWMHNGFLMVEGEKMSKSLGNFFTVRDMLDQGHAGETLRLVMLQTHYRQPLDWRAEGIARAKETLDRFYLALRGAPVGAAAAEPRAVIEALLDDLNTPSALSALHADLAALNKAATEPERASARARLVAGGALLGLLQAEPEAWLRGTGAAASAGLDDAAIEALIAGRNAARKAKDFKEADRIRAELAAARVIIEDGPKGTTWRRG
ncbi:MAG: cysteine--tRNA ligase [Alphaproteobacteria bacterium]|nr:cysteine--tRNA ligase [Alphaproteobacteria bacterium]